jgi:hypothetical protein
MNVHAQQKKKATKTVFVRSVHVSSVSESKKMDSTSAEFIRLIEHYHAFSAGSVFGYLLRKQICKHFFSYILCYEANPKGRAFQWI